jgi:hypothetical protein
MVFKDGHNVYETKCRDCNENVPTLWDTCRLEPEECAHSHLEVEDRLEEDEITPGVTIYLPYQAVICRECGNEDISLEIEVLSLEEEELLV